jgi:serine/threonine-protein kinase
MAVDIPNYRVIEKLGTGAQSRIFRARNMRNGKDYTVKIVKVVKPEDAGFVELLRAEYAIGTAVDHPVIRKVYELRMMRHRLRVRGAILFMEYVPGISMGEKEFKYSLPEVLKFFGLVADGLYAMHVAGFVHADLKPTNILITPDERVKLIDLGQSAGIRQAKSRVQGTIDYMAPEQVQRGVLSERTDVFGLGATLHKVLTGKAIATEMNQTISMHSQSLVGRRVNEIRESVMHELPTCVQRLINDCCQTDPNERLLDMAEVSRRIELARTIVTKRAKGRVDDEDLLEDDEATGEEEDATVEFDPEV